MSFTIDLSARLIRLCKCMHMFDVLGTNWGPTDRVLFMQTCSVKMLLLREKNAH